MKTWKVRAETVIGVAGLCGKQSPVAPHNVAGIDLELSPGTLQPHKSGSKKGGRRAAERGGVWPCLLLRPRVTAVHFSFTQRRSLAFISPKANFVCNYSFSLHVW